MATSDNQLFAGAEVQFYNYVFSFISSMCLKCALQLGIPDIIHNHGNNKPITLSDLVDALSLPSSKTEYVHRLMRFLVHTGCFAYDEDQQGYLLTPLSRLLLKDAKNNMSALLLCMLDPALITPWHFLSTWFRETNETIPFNLAHGMNIWDYNVQKPELNTLFNEAMACDTKWVVDSLVNDPEVQKVFDKKLTTFIDVGGCTGAVARAVAEAYPHLKCSVLDLPHVVAEAPRNVTKNVVEYIGGDMFESIPNADTIFMKCVLHDWSDEHCLKVLKKCREAILPSKEKGGKVIVVDIVVEDTKEEEKRTQAQFLLDMCMFAYSAGGKERNEKQWETLFLEAGFSHYKKTPLAGIKSLFEVYP